MIELGMAILCVALLFLIDKYGGDTQQRERDKLWRREVRNNLRPVPVANDQSKPPSADS